MIIDKNSKIYLYCFAQYATGGPESMHQLYYNLKDLGYNAFVYYYPASVENPVHERFQKYSPNIASKIDDQPENILIIPETATFLLSRFKKIQKVIHWLSVDNYYVSLNDKKESFLKALVKRVLGWNKKYLLENPTHAAMNIHHVSQSKYAREHLKKFGIENVHYLPDYIHQNFYDFKSDNTERTNVVLYNPLKGIDVTKKIIAAAPDIEFIPLQNLTAEQVAEKLSSSKVYIDFGNHPGKDRFPREAAILGCCIITNRRGSAFYQEDLPIPESFKFEEEEIPEIVTAIRNILGNYDVVSREFDSYRNFIDDHYKQLRENILTSFPKNFNQ